MHFNACVLSCVCALAAGSAAHGAENLRFGGQVAQFTVLGEAQSNLSSNPGGSFGLHLAIQVAPGQELRPQFNFDVYPRKTPAGYQGWTNQQLGISGGVAYLYYLLGRRQGFYVMAGLEAFSTSNWGGSAHPAGSPYYQNADNRDYRDTDGFQPLVGMGFRFNRWTSVEAAVRFSNMQRPYGGTRDGAQLVSLAFIIH